MRTKKIGSSLEIYIREPKRKPRLKEVTRHLTEQQIQSLLNCKNCKIQPIVFIRVGKGKKIRDIGVCAQDWERISGTVLGWSGE